MSSNSINPSASHDHAQASGIGILYSFARVEPQADIFVIELQNWITAFFALTLATNIICTSASFVRCVQRMYH